MAIKTYKILPPLFMMALIYVGTAHAALNLSVAPLSGGNNLRFGRVSSDSQVNKEVRITITSTEATQYQVYHRIVDSFVNEQGATIGSMAVSTYTLAGSNDSGTLYAQSPERLGYTDQLLYTSGSGGVSDAFTAVYTVDGSQMDAFGNFFGRIQYVARPVGGASQDDVFLNVSIETSGEFKIEIEASTTRDSLRLNTQSESQKEGYIDIAFEENFGQRIEIFQELEPYLENEQFEELDPGTVIMVATGNSGAELYPRVPSDLPRKRTLIYSSAENKDTVRLNYALDQGKLEMQKAGIYKGQLHFIVDQDFKETMHTVQMEVQVDPIFAIEVDLPPQGLHFDRLLPDSSPILREVKVNVKTNLGKPYMVMQNVTSPMTNKEGTQMPKEYFTFKGDPLDYSTGKMVVSEFSPVPDGETSIYISDNKGSPSRFNISYRLKPYATMVPGDYTTAIRYSLGEI